GLARDVPRHRIRRDAPQPREARARPLEDRAPVVHRQHQRVAVGHEHLLDRLDVGAEVTRGGVEIVQRVAQVADAERLFPVHVAVRAVVPRAADRGLQDVRVRLGGRAVEGAFVTHRPGVVLAGRAGPPAVDHCSPAAAGLSSGRRLRTRPTSWWLAALRKRRARMASETLDLSQPPAFASVEEHAEPIAFYNAAYRAEESGLRQAHELADEMGRVDP